MPGSKPEHGLSGKDRLKIISVILITGLVFVAVLAAFRIPDNRIPDNRMLVKGKPFFWAGVNYPWRSYQDFGTGAWGHSGVSQETSYAEIDTDFTNLAAQGVRIVKWRVFNDGRISPEFDQNGFATGLDEKFFADIDTALQIAEKHDLYLVLTLFSSGLWTTDCEKEGVRFGVGPGLMTDPLKRKALIDNALVPFLKHIGSNPRVLAYEVIAEPEWGVQELHLESDFRLKAPLVSVRDFIKDATTTVHTITAARVTVESNRPSNMKNWKGLGLDFYTFSWYDWMDPYDPLDVPASFYELDKPIVLGEFPASGSVHYDIARAYDIAYTQGYAGAFAWSYASGDKHSDWTSARESYVSWVQGHWGEVNVTPGASSLPDLSSPVIPRPYVPLPAEMKVLSDTLAVNLDVQIRQGGTYIVKSYLYKMGEDPQDDGRQKTVSIGDNGRLQTGLDFSGVASGQNYKLSLAIFDPSFNLLTWIDGYVQLRLEDGEIKPPNIPPQALENPCYQAD